jgi:hypothetical protein
MEALHANPAILAGTLFCGLPLSPEAVAALLTADLQNAFLEPRFVRVPGTFNPLIAIAVAVTGVAVEISVPIGHSHLEKQTYAPPGADHRTAAFEYTTLCGGD